MDEQQRSAVDTLARLGGFAPPEALARLRRIAEALPSWGAPERLTIVAGALPRRVAGLSPEVGLALAQLALALAHHSPRIPEDLGELPERLQVEWLRVQLTAGDPSSPWRNPSRRLAWPFRRGRCRRNSQYARYNVVPAPSPRRKFRREATRWIAPRAALLDRVEPTLVLRAVTGWSIVDIADPSALLHWMSNAADPRLREAVFERLDSAVRALAIRPEHARIVIRRLAEDPLASVRRAAFAALSGRDPSRLSFVRAGLGDADLDVVQTCVKLAADAGARDWLLDLGFDDQRGVDERAAAIEGLGPIARDEDLGPVLELAVADPLGFGACVRRFLLAAHRHGVFVRAEQIPAMLAAFDAHHGWTAEAFVRVTHIVRTQVVAALAQLPSSDPRWIRRASILAASLGSQAAELLGVVLNSTSDARIALALIDAAGRSPDYAAEAPLLAWLSRLPEAVIPVLRVKGGAEAALQLHILVADRACRAGLRPLALDALWALSDDRETLLRELCGQLGPHAAGLLDKARVAARDDRAAAILSDPPWPPDPAHTVEPLAALALLCESGRRRFLPEVTRRFRDLVQTYVAAALAGDFTIKRLRMPELEQLVYRYGRHMIADGRSVRRWIEAGPDTGRELVLRLAIEWLREDPPGPICVALLEMIGRHQPTGASLRQIEEFWRHRDPEVQRAALEAILAAGEAARGLELSIGRLAEAGDPRILRQALAGVAGLGARWAEPLVIAALARPEMAIKKQAAAALEQVGTRRCIPALLEWLAIHDNVGFRAALLEALDTVAGPSAPAILVNALARADERRAKELLRDALDRRLSLHAILRLVRSNHPDQRALVDAALAKDLRLTDACVAQLATALHRAKLRPLAKVELDDPVRRLGLDGFSPAAALAVVELSPAKKLEQRAAIQQLVRTGIAEWLSWLSGELRPESTQAQTAGLALVLDATTSAHFAQFDALLALVEAGVELEPGLVVEFLERCHIAPELRVEQRARALAILRALPIAAEVGGPRRFALLAKLGAVRGREDLERCLAECRIGPSLADDSARLLCAAFSIPAKQADEALALGPSAAAELERLRAEAKDWYRMNPSDAQAWLSRLLLTRPIDLAPLGFGPKPEHETKQASRAPRSRAELDALLAMVQDAQAEPQARARAAEQILAWLDARLVADSWAQVLEVYLAGEIDLSRAAKLKLAGLLQTWPAKARDLFEYLDREQRRRFVPTWVAAWEAGDPEAGELLQGLGQEWLIAEARSRAVTGNYALLRLLKPERSLAMAELIEFVGARAPAQVAGLLPDAVDDDQSPKPSLVDPLDELDLDGLVELIGERSGEIGLAVRAVHALTQFESRGADALEPLTLDRRPKVRSAALRALRKVAPRERCLHAIARVLAIESRPDVIGSLLASLGHGRYEPGLSILLEYCVHRDPKLREHAEQAVLAWGSSVLPALRRAARKARPDRRPSYEALIDALEADTE